MIDEPASSSGGDTTRSPDPVTGKRILWVSAACIVVFITAAAAGFAFLHHRHAAALSAVETAHSAEMESASASASAAIDNASDTGYRDGYRAGESVAASGAYDEGRSDGYAAGLSAGTEAAAGSAYSDGYLDGAEYGYQDGYADGYSDGYVPVPTMSVEERIEEYNRALECLLGARDWRCD